MLMERSHALSNLDFEDLSKVEEQGGIVIQINNTDNMSPEEYSDTLARMQYLKKSSLVSAFRAQIKPIYREIMKAEGISRDQLETAIVDMRLLLDYYYLYGEDPAQHFSRVF